MPHEWYESMFSSLQPICRGTKHPLNDRTVPDKPAVATAVMARRN